MSITSILSNRSSRPFSEWTSFAEPEHHLGFHFQVLSVFIESILTKMEPFITFTSSNAWHDLPKRQTYNIYYIGMSEFYQRESELDYLVNCFESISGPKVVAIQGFSGTGKTRLVQEFYNTIAKQTAYWRPFSATLGKKELEVVPPFKEVDQDLTWLFLSARSVESKGNNYDFAFERIRQQFSYHLPQIVKTLKNKSVSKKIAKSALSVLLNFSIPGGGNIIELLNLLKDSVTDSLDVAQLLNDIGNGVDKKVEKGQEKLYLTEIQSTIQTLVNVLKEIFSKQGDFKIIIYLEDFHWIDLYSKQILKELFQVSKEKKWNVFFVVSHWPIHIFSSISPERQVLNEFQQWTSLLTPDQYALIAVDQLRKKNLFNLVKERLPNLQREVVIALVKRCQGDIDLLNDFIDEIEQTMGWIVDGRLQVPLKKLNELPSRSIEMAKSRISSFPEKVRRHLIWSSLQGITFDYELISQLLYEYDDPTDFYNNLVDADKKFGIIDTHSNPLFGLTGEFKRAVFYEACSSFIRRHPTFNKFKLFIIEKLNELILGNTWEFINGGKRGRIVQTFAYLISETVGVSTDIVRTKIRCLIDLSRDKLLIGDYKKAIEISLDTFEKIDDQDVTLKNDFYSILAQCYYCSGEVQKEKDIYKKWSQLSKDKSYEYHVQYAKFLRRSSFPSDSVKHINYALNKSSTTYELINAKIELIKSLWSNGLQFEAYDRLSEIDVQFRRELAAFSSLEASYNHSCCLVLHDLEKSKQVLQFASKCIDGYEKKGDIQSMLISRVNYGDALLGLGYIATAQHHLKKTCDLTMKYDLPHVKDIAYICYANVLSMSGFCDQASHYYERGIAIAEQIEHDWDAIYGKIYAAVNTLKHDNKAPVNLENLLDLSLKSKYYYLADLAFAAMCYKEYICGNNFDSLKGKYRPTLPIGNVFYLSLLILTDRYADSDIGSFLGFLGKCEGVKLNSEQIVSTLEKIVSHSLVKDSVLLEFCIRWSNTYRPRRELNQIINLKACDYRACEARCCYDGVYLQDGEEQRIVDAITTYPDYFTHLHGDFIVDGDWEGMSGRKTAVKAHQYKSPDFPVHFKSTRCVFAYDDGACSLQRLSLETTGDGWVYKPVACQTHPLQTMKGEFYAPPSTIEKDKHDIGIAYPGYVSYTPCGVDRLDGRIWVEELSGEIASFLSSE